jgi:hypothetical protein
MRQPETLLLIRHGEKPVKDDSGVDQHGNVDGDGLIPKGWARAGALATLFDANDITLRSTLPSPDALVSPLYSKPIHRTCLTLLPLAKRLDLKIHRKNSVTDAKGAAGELLQMDARVVLVCWEHHNLVDIVSEIGKLATVTNPHDLPSTWPDDRFDVIWRFDSADSAWTFSTGDQQLLQGDVFDT